MAVAVSRMDHALFVSEFTLRFEFGEHRFELSFRDLTAATADGSSDGFRIRFGSFGSFK